MHFLAYDLGLSMGTIYIGYPWTVFLNFIFFSNVASVEEKQILLLRYSYQTKKLTETSIEKSKVSLCPYVLK